MKLTTLTTRLRERTARQKRADIESDFYVTEKDGAIWIMHSGNAIRQFTADDSVTKIIFELTQFRTTAIKYEADK